MPVKNPFHILLIILMGLCVLVSSGHSVHAKNEWWGFYGHRLINRMAVFTLPIELIHLFKGNIEFITEHAVDPDKRRYSAKLEAVRHYIDLDHWGVHPFEEVPRSFTEALVYYSQIHVVDRESGDTLQTWSDRNDWNTIIDQGRKKQLLQEVNLKLFEWLDNEYLLLPDSWLPVDFQPSNHQLIITEYFSGYGILPYHLVIYQKRLTRAFRDQNYPLVIRLSTELGHYLSDAHVPLHTTENYNGQLTGQDGIHAFWESRIPELFAEESYDFFVGRAKYIENTDQFFWDIVLESHSYVKEVLAQELILRRKYQKDQQYCFEERGSVTARLECPAYAKAYEEAMGGMVEERMRKSIAAIGSAWYTAWVDAGSPPVKPVSAQANFDKNDLIRIDSMSIQNEGTLPSNEGIRVHLPDDN